MADSTKIAEHFPGVADFKLSELTALRGDVISYRANIDKPSFSTDAQGFRHTEMGGRKLSVAECIQSPRYGITLGASNFFAPGIAGNENTLASRLSERFGFPFANASMPGGNSRNLNSLLVGLLAGAKQPPAMVIFSNGGDLANFCNAGFVDPIFGSPNYVQMKGASDPPAEVDADTEFRRLLVFTGLWTSAIAALCRLQKIPLSIAHQATFFEKSTPSTREKACSLGEAKHAPMKRLFANFRKYGPPFFANREELARRFALPIVGVGMSDRLTFFDEFHLDVEGLGLLSDAVAEVIAPIMDERTPAVTAS